MYTASLPVFIIHTTYLTESFSTANRGLADSISYNIDRIGGAIAPPIIGLIATHTSFAIGFFVICTAYLITVLFVKDRIMIHKVHNLKT